MMASQEAMPWVKLYTEMLDDTKLAFVSERAKWRFVQLILLAGECDHEGELRDSLAPLTIEKIAWRLHIDPIILRDDLSQLSGLIQCTHGVPESHGDLWIVTKFAERQSRPQSEQRELWRLRQKKHRDKERVTSESPVTHASRVEEEKDKEKDIRIRGGDPPKFLPPNAKVSQEEEDFLRTVCEGFDTKPANTFQVREICKLRVNFGEEVTLEALRFYADQGIDLDEAVKRAKGALPTWGQGTAQPWKKNGNGSKPVNSLAAELERREAKNGRT